LIPQGPPSSGIALPMPEVKEICEPVHLRRDVSNELLVGPGIS
jgi:hypothetical protein